METLFKIVLLIIPIAVAVVFHEIAHGYTALRFGDRTAKDMGRLTLNPIAHIHWFGTIVMPASIYLMTQFAMGQGFLFAFAKPVPVDMRNFNNPKRDMIWVAAAGPAMSILLAIISAMLFRLTAWAAPEAYILFEKGGQMAGADVTSMFLILVFFMLLVSVNINAVLAIINLFPLPPADGGRIVTGLLPDRLAWKYARLENYGLGILLFVFLVNPLDIIHWTLMPAIEALVYLLLA